jgi:hypothetical protein
MNRFFIAPIVEGKGEVEAVPKLLHRIFASAKAVGGLDVNPPLRVKAGSFLQDNEYFNKYVELAARRVKTRLPGGVLILLDCEDACPAKLGPALLGRARQVHSDVSYVVALAYREYETWFLAAAKSLRSIAGLPAELEPPSVPERIRGAKQWLARNLPTGYDEVEHQLLFTENFSFTEAATIRSFVRFKRKIEQWFP